MNATTDATSGLRLLELGMGWFPEQPGGLNRFYFDLIKTLSGARLGIEVRGLVTGSSSISDATNGVVSAFAPTGTSLLSRLIRARTKTRATLATFGPDLVVSHFSLYTWPVLDLVKSTPLVVHFQGPWAQESSTEGRRGLGPSVKRFIERSVYRRSTRSIVLSNAFGSILQRDYGVPQEFIRVVPGAVDTSRFAIEATRDDARALLGWPADRPTFLTVRRLAHRMGLPMLIEAASQVANEFPDVLFMIAGKGPLAERLVELVAERRLERNVRLLGYVNDESLPLAYRAADLSIVPTVSLEGFGLIAAESLAAGTPVLVTPVGGLPEIIGPFRKDMVVQETTAEALAAKVQDLLAGRMKPPSPAECQTYARQQYDWSVIAPRVIDVYREAVHAT